MINKNKARKIIQDRLRNMTKEDMDKANRIIFKKVIQTLDLTQNKTFSIFVSFAKEVETLELIEFLIKNNQRVVVPSVVGNKMVMREITSVDFESEKFLSIRQPSKKHKIILPNEIDIIFVPCLGFDSKNNRLGRGGGFYDKYLEKTNAQKTLLAFKEQRLENFECETHDIKMDLIISN